MRDHFLFRKENQLKKNDKSLKNSWDNRIKELCRLINENGKYYTTSSCSGRILILIDSREKKDDLFLYCSHDLINLDELKKELGEIKDKTKNLIYFKQEPVILHIACKSLDDAQKIHDLAKDAGWKRCGIIASGKRFMVELNATGKLEFPIINNGQVLVDDAFLSLIAEEANKKLKLSWEKINSLEKTFLSL